METAAALASKREEVKIAEQQLATLKAKADAAIAAAKREEEKLLEIDKYKIQNGDKEFDQTILSVRLCPAMGGM